MKKILFIMIIFFLFCFNSYAEDSMQLSSPSFKENERIPKKFTCHGDDINPELNISNVPKEAVSLVLIVDDPDAPMGTWTHWVVFNIPATTKTIKKNSIPGLQGLNSFGKLNYAGPCPPGGTHRYFFRLYALDTTLSLPPGLDRKELEKAMDVHVIKEIKFVGIYKANF